jgi:hypothetical protein
MRTGFKPPISLYEALVAVDPNFPMGGMAHRPDAVLVARVLRYAQCGFSGRSDRAQRWLKKGRGHRGR